MAEDDKNHDGPLPAGGFSAWMGGMGRALDGEAPSDVPCGGCTACCRSSQFVHIGPDEVDTLAHIPPALRFPAPRMRPGNVLLGYDENGHCPMLVDDRCSIYEHRPRTCRTYDCRVFPAAGVVPDDDEQLAIAHRARRWRFDFPEEATGSATMQCRRRRPGWWSMAVSCRTASRRRTPPSSRPSPFDCTMRSSATTTRRAAW